MALIEAPGRGLTISQQIAKRAFDIAGAGVALLVLGPVMLVAALAIAVLDGRPVLFRQSREGQAGRAFQMLKFRTMTPAPPPSASTFTRAATAGQAIDAHKRRSDARVTPVGRILRKWSIDELPQLWNVLRGDMSLVGPRPLPLYESAHLDGWHQSRRDLKPGLTGLWQVMGRTTIPWDERMQLDYHYVSHWSVASDLRILARTVPVVLKRDGAV
jgi:lipopolysaccharide/colanic/teichoic acid biosynthesis glycosyltransferase